jgi:hypothetical protein
VIIDHVQDLDLGAAGQTPVRDVGLPAIFGISAENRMKELRGRLCGCAVTTPRRLKIRQIVATDGIDSPR